jgi:UMP-CMP kinase
MLDRILKRGKTSGRTDDNIETAKKRFETFNREQLPVVKEFEFWEMLDRVDASGSIDECFAAVRSALKL